MANLAIIPARGGSKRIPRKNIKDFLGKPIIAYSIEAALQCGLFEKVIVSTDDAEIALVAETYGAEVPFLRSKKNSNDFATTIDVIQEVLKIYQNNSIYFDFVCCIYATAPFISSNRLKEGLKNLTQGNYTSVFPIMAYSSPIWRALEIDINGFTKMIWPEYNSARSQDLKKVYHDAGQWYWLNTKTIGNELYTKNSGSIILEESEGQDIDNQTDWDIAQIKYTQIKRNE